MTTMLDKEGLAAARAAYQSAIPSGCWHADGGETDAPIHAAIACYLTHAASDVPEPVAWRWRGPMGGWVYDGTKPTKWHSEPVYGPPAATALSAIQAENAGLKAEREWHPIETAPKDGTVVDLWHEEWGRQPDCFWGLSHHECGEAGRYCDSEWHGAPEGWVDSTLNQPTFDDGFTHWMLEPAGPAAARSTLAKEGGR